MGDDRPEKEAASESGDVGASATTTESGDESPDSVLLLRQYGEAMTRIGRLETQFQQLARQLQTGLAGEQSGDRPPQDTGGVGGTAEGAVSPEEAERGLSGTPATSSPSPGDTEDLRQLRVQLTSVANKLAQTEREMRQVQGSSPKRRRRKNQHRPWWRAVWASRRPATPDPTSRTRRPRR